MQACLEKAVVHTLDSYEKEDYRCVLFRLELGQLKRYLFYVGDDRGEAMALFAGSDEAARELYRLICEGRLYAHHLADVISDAEWNMENF